LTPRTLEHLGTLSEEALVYWDRDNVGSLLPDIDTDDNHDDEHPRIYQCYPIVALPDDQELFFPEFSLFVGTNEDGWSDPAAVYYDGAWTTRIERHATWRAELERQGVDRDTAKAIELGTAYGMGIDRLNEILRRK
jgi:hypothetical protein